MRIARAKRVHAAIDGFRGEGDTNRGAGGHIVEFDPAPPSIDAGDEHLPTVTAAAWEALRAASVARPCPHQTTCSYRFSRNWTREDKWIRHAVGIGFTALR